MCKSYVRTMYGLSCHEHDQTSMGPEKVSTYYQNNWSDFATFQLTCYAEKTFEHPRSFQPRIWSIGIMLF